MIKKLQKSGDSYALIIDTDLIEQLGILPDTPLQVVVSAGALVITPALHGAGEATVAESLAKIRQQPGYSEMLENLAK